MQVLAYTDIHYHQYTNGITVYDVTAVEQQMLDIAKSRKVDLILFGGDRFVSRNPMYQSKLESDKMLKRISESGIPWVGIIGNHDRLTKNDFESHNLEHLGLYPNDLSGIHVMGSVGRLHIAGVYIHGIPAGHPLRADLVPGATNIVMFHALVRGSMLQNGFTAPDGESVSSFDEKDVTVILGGDNHARQPLPGLKIAPGFYMGAPMQHNWGDEGAERGFNLLTIENNRLTRTEFIESNSPKFMTHYVELDGELDAQALSKMPWKNNIVDLRIHGDRETLSTYDFQSLEAKLKSATGARRLKVRLSYKESKQQPLMVYSSEADEWSNFLNSRKHTLDSIDFDYLHRLGLSYLG